MCDLICNTILSQRHRYTPSDFKVCHQKVLAWKRLCVNPTMGDHHHHDVNTKSIITKSHEITDQLTEPGTVRRWAYRLNGHTLNFDSHIQTFDVDAGQIPNSE